MKNDEKHDLLEVKGILSKGFGMMPRAIMTDPGIHAVSKTILGYFLSYAGMGKTAFPGREKILSDLAMSPNTYDKYMKPLRQEGYISVRQQNSGGMGKGYGHNIYTLDLNAGHDGDGSAEAENYRDIPAEGRFASLFSGIYSDGYGLVPKTVMTDPALSPVSKAIYLYISAFSGGTGKAHPAIDMLIRHLGISRHTYQTHLRKLTERGYLEVVQHHGSDGKMAGNSYILLDRAAGSSTPGEELSTDDGSYAPYANICDTQILPHGRNCDTQNLPHGKKPQTQICGTKISTPENDISKTDPSGNRAYPSKEDAADGSIPETAEEYYQDHRTEVRRALFEKEKIPVEWAEDEFRLVTAVRILTEWDGMNERFRDAEMYPDLETDRIQDSEYVYRLFTEALTELLEKSRSPHRMLGQEVAYTQIHSKLSEWYEYDPERRCLTLSELRQKACDAFPKEEEIDEIRNPLAYMKSCIWSLLRAGPRKKPMRPPGRE